MGCDLDDLKEAAEDFKQKVWYYIDCNLERMEADETVLKRRVNDLLDYIDELEG